MNKKGILTILMLIMLGVNTGVFAQESEQCAFQPLVLNPSEVVFSNSKTNLSTIDPAVTSSYYPGGRGTNQLIIYTPKYGRHTQTNEFGTEAIVKGNTVVALSGADSQIPPDGFVISGHGYAKNWITQNITVGSKIYINTEDNTITAYTTSDSYIYEAQGKIAEAQSMIDYYKSTTAGYNSSVPDKHIEAARNFLKNANKEGQDSTILQQSTKDAINEANLAIKTALPYYKNELKGLWIRPTETSEAQIIATLDKIKSNGFNNVFLETYFHGKTIFPSKTMNKYGFTIQNRNFEGIDPLKIWITEAHKRGIKVHTWFQSFYVGNEPPSHNSSSILAVRPDWGNKTKKFASIPGPTISASEHNGYFIDPANPEVQDFLVELIEEIIFTYHPDGINLDYIRYPNANAGNDINAWGFTEYARNEFKNIYDVDPIELTLSDARWYDWNQYRRDKITNFVRKIGLLGRKNKVYISAVIFPDIASALATKQQDWRQWSAWGYIDGFTPLFLTYDSKMLSSMMNDVMSVKDSNTDLYAGLFVTFMGGSSEDLIRQIYEARKLCANGIILFDYAHTTPQYTTTLLASAFKSNEISNIKPVKTRKSKDNSQKQKNIDKSNKPVKVQTNNKGFWVFGK